MDEFLSKFFPSVYRKSKDQSCDTNQYCKYDSQLLTLFTSSLYLAALVASFIASTVNRVFGRKTTMFVGGIFFLAGSSLNAFAQNVEMLIAGRIFLGIGVGFANQVCICMYMYFISSMYISATICCTSSKRMILLKRPFMYAVYSAISIGNGTITYKRSTQYCFSTGHHNRNIDCKLIELWFFKD